MRFERKRERERKREKERERRGARALFSLSSPSPSVLCWRHSRRCPGRARAPFASLFVPACAREVAPCPGIGISTRDVGKRGRNAERFFSSLRGDFRRRSRRQRRFFSLARPLHPALLLKLLHQTLAPLFLARPPRGLDLLLRGDPREKEALQAPCAFFPKEGSREEEEGGALALSR